MADIHVGALTIRFVVEEPSVSVFECHVPAGGRVPAAHSHDGFEEAIYGLRGLVRFTVGGVVHELGPGDAAFVPRGVVHGFDAGEEGGAFLAVATPGSFGAAYFTELADVVAASAGGPPDREALVAVMRRHGLEPA